MCTYHSAGNPRDRTISEYALLLGSDHTELGTHTISDVGERVAIGISCGRFPKGYPHVDPNEDAVFASTDGETTVLAVADGHGGFDIARAAIESVAHVMPPIEAPSTESLVHRLADAAVDAAAEAVAALTPPRTASETAITIAVIRGDRIAATTIGDTSCFVVARRHSTRLSSATDFYLPRQPSAPIDVTSSALPRAASVVVTSDGLVDFTRNIDKALMTIVGESPSNGAEQLLSTAFKGGAGDNVAVAILTPEQ